MTKTFTITITGTIEGVGEQWGVGDEVLTLAQIVERLAGEAFVQVSEPSDLYFGIEAANVQVRTTVEDGGECHICGARGSHGPTCTLAPRA